MKGRGVVVTGAGSGSGKTLTTLTLLKGLSEKGFYVHPFKCGPDFIDPRYHEWICGTPSMNLDLYFSDPLLLRERYNRLIAESSGGIVEGVMGLFDGLERKSSTYDIAQALDLPVILVISAQGMAETVAALVRGILTHRPGLDLLGVIATRTGSDRHRDMIKMALDKEGLPPLLGVVPRNDSLSLPERYLGLSRPGEQGEERGRAFLDTISQVAETFDWPNILPAFKEKTFSSLKTTPDPSWDNDFLGASRRRIRKLSDQTRQGGSQRGLRIGIALDEAFWFYYPENWEVFAKVGIQIEFFSPLKDRKLPSHCDGLYFGGGYPEIYARELSDNTSMLSEVRTFCESGQPVYAECGGMLYLTEGPRINEGEDDMPFVGFFPLRYTLGDRLKRLGYAEVRSEGGFFSGASGPVRGHLFHYSRLLETKAELLPAFRHTADHRPEGYFRKGVIGSYLHLFFPSNPSWAAVFAQALVKGI